MLVPLFAKSPEMAEIGTEISIFVAGTWEDLGGD